MLPLNQKKQMNTQVEALQKRMEVLQNTQNKLNMIDDFNKRLGVFNGAVTEMETWLSDARGRIDDIIKPSQVTKFQAQKNCPDFYFLLNWAGIQLQP